MILNSTLISFVIKAYKANPALGKWVSKQRDAFREFQNSNQNPKINQEKIEKLKSIGFKFVIGKGKAIRQWDQFFASLVAFKEKFGEKSKIFMFSCLFVCFVFFHNERVFFLRFQYICLEQNRAHEYTFELQSRSSVREVGESTKKK